MSVEKAVQYALVVVAALLFAGTIPASAVVTGAIVAAAATVVFFESDPTNAVSVVKELLTAAEKAVEAVRSTVENRS